MDFPTIYGFNECSDVGNDTFAPSVFLGGCNLKCPYCMNSNLLTDNKKEVQWSTVRDYIKKNEVEWIMISGGEPTCIQTKLLKNLINSFIGIGCKVGLSTNGTNTEKLSYVIGDLNYVAMDIKSSKPYVYEEISGNNSLGTYNEFHNVIRTHSLLSKNKLMREDFDYEIRTTLYPNYIDKKTLKEIGFMIVPGEKWVLQQFRHANHMLSDEAYKVNPYTDEEAKMFLRLAKKITSKARLRYV